VLNLGAFEQFFEERRPFFLEGAGIFSFRNSCNDIDTGCRGPVLLAAHRPVAAARRRLR
jgi:hypothetical protein